MKTIIKLNSCAVVRICMYGFISFVDVNCRKGHIYWSQLRHVFDSMTFSGKRGFGVFLFAPQHVEVW